MTQTTSLLMDQLHHHLSHSNTTKHRSNRASNREAIMSEAKTKAMALGGGPLADPCPLPDLNHLTEEERRIIESVMARQREEDDKEKEILRKKQDEVKVLEESIKMRNEEQKKVGTELDATCEICMKTKFADGIGHLCNYCQVRCCARCGGKVTLRSNKVIWVCILCRKKQELLIKTGQWMHGGMAGQPLINKMALDLGLLPVEGVGIMSELTTPTAEKKLRLEKENFAPSTPQPTTREAVRRQCSIEAKRNNNKESARRRSFVDEPGTGRGHACSPERERTRPLRTLDPMHDSSDVTKTHLDPASASTSVSAGRGRRVDAAQVLRNDSLSSDQSECVRPPPPKPHKHKQRGKKLRQPSLSSSEDEIRSTPECTSCDEQEIESESVSEKGELENCPYLNDHNPERFYHRHYKDADGASTRKMVRFHADGERQWSQESQNKDSGFDTSSSATLSEENNKQGNSKHPVSWQPLADGTQLRGHMILKKTVKENSGNSSSASILGLKVVGGQVIGVRGELGSIADTVGHLRSGDEIVEWNGRSLRHKTVEQVADIIAESKQEPQVELMVLRSIRDVNRGERDVPHESHAPAQGTRSTLASGRSGSYDSSRRPSVTITSPDSPERSRPVMSSSSQIGGRIQVKLWFDSQVSTLIVTVVCAAELPPRPTNQARNPYVKMFLLPDRSEKSKRRTKTLANTNEPRWNQTFMYAPLQRSELKNRRLEITVWNYDRYGSNDFLGEVSVDLATSPMDDEPEWYFLQPHDQGLPLKAAPRTTFLNAEQMSMSNPVSRFSDSDLSDPDERTAREVFSREEYYQHRRRESLTVPDKNSSGRFGMNPTSSTMSSVGHNSRTRSKSPRQLVDSSRSLSPPDGRISMMSHTLTGARPSARSVSATPATTPPLSRRQLPRLPAAFYRSFGSRDTLPQDIESRTRFLKSQIHKAYSSGGGGGGGGGSSSSSAIRYDHGMYSDSEVSSRVPERYSLRRRSTHMISPDKKVAHDVGDSDLESISAFSTQSERPHGTRSTYKEFTNRMQTFGPTTSSKSRESQSGSRVMQENKPSDGSLSDTTVGSVLDKQRRRSITAKLPNLAGLSRKSNSTSQLSATEMSGRKRSTSATSGIQRSQEVNPAPHHTVVKQASKESMDGSMNSISSGSSSWLPSLRLSSEGHFADFVEGLGPGQLVGRQVLASASVGDVQLSLHDRKGNLEVEVIRARGLQAKVGAKVLPAPYVKVYLVDGKRCVAKAKTSTARRTLDPLYQQQLLFHRVYQGCVLQVTVWGDYGRIEGRKVFMGVAQILLDDLDLSNIVIGWYKLFGTSSLVTLPGTGSRRGSMLSLDSFG
uniref:Regulating synaptic membrane exocytosis protein 2 n=1 Tax=Strigamia maritima TaxID=126957 RepID=T1ITJ4_STRMM